MWINDYLLLYYRFIGCHQSGHILSIGRWVFLLFFFSFFECRFVQLHLQLRNSVQQIRHPPNESIFISFVAVPHSNSFWFCTCMWPKHPNKKKRRKTVWFKLQSQWFRFHWCVLKDEILQVTVQKCVKSQMRQLHKLLLILDYFMRKRNSLSSQLLLFFSISLSLYFSLIHCTASVLCTWTININELNFISAIFSWISFYLFWFCLHRNSFCKCFECWCVVKRHEIQSCSARRK